MKILVALGEKKLSQISFSRELPVPMERIYGEEVHSAAS